MGISKKAQSISPSPTMTIDAKYKAMRAAGEDVIGFAAGEPDFDTPDYIKAAAIEAINKGFTKYTPASGTPELKRAICDKLQRDNGLTYKPSDIVVSNGAKHSLVNIFVAICDPGDEIIIPAPYWVSYPEMVKIGDGVPVIMHTKEEDYFKFTVDDLRRMITPKTRGLIINSPSNPTGMVYSRQELADIAALAVEKNIYVISDEIYEKLVYDDVKHFSIASFGEEIKNLTIVVNGVSKSHAMTGWRIGYTASNAEIAKAMADIQSHATSNPNSIAQVAATAALNGNDEFVEMMRNEFLLRRNYMVERINSMSSISCKSPHGAFYVMMNVANLLGQEYYGKWLDYKKKAGL